ncbi:hypothetical protein LCGC14_0817300 [marine sediment metagenome]|uniref:Uncharacterized protein n=1 Tax=marine sediment metagenome TaxID=412755 RepID=A0A0F9PPL7_9ZZZZ
MPNLHVSASRPIDDKWRKMRTAQHACKAAGIAEPTQVKNYFAYMSSREIIGNEDDDVAELSLTNTPCCSFYHGAEKSFGPGLTIHLARLPKGVTALHFFIS